MAGVDSIAASGNPQLTGHVTVSEGSGITLTQVGQDIEVAVTPLEPTAGMRAWYDANDTGTLTIVSNRVSQWNDKSGNVLHLTQGTAADRPFYNAAPRTINGIICPEFTPTVEFMDSALSTSDRTSTHFLVALADDFASERTALGSLTAGGGGFELHFNSNSVRIAKAGVAFLWDNGMFTTPTNPFLLCIRMSATALNVVSGGGFQSLAEATTFTAGQTLRLGTEPTGAQPWDGLIGEYLVYDTTLADADMQHNLLYLYDKWFN